MSGIDAYTGRALSGWPHTQQSISRILGTSFLTRVMRREVGSDVPKLQDANPTPQTLLRLYVAVAVALDKWEPRFLLKSVSLLDANSDGVHNVSLPGVWFPRGHLGDYSMFEDKSATFIIPEAYL